MLFADLSGYTAFAERMDPEAVKSLVDRALLRLGQSLAALGEKEAACASLGEVLRKFPRASAGVKQGVEREQKRVRC